MDVSKMSTEELQALRAMQEGAQVRLDAQPIADRSNVGDLPMGALSLPEAANLMAARTFQGNDNAAVANVIKGMRPGTEVQYDVDPKTQQHIPYVVLDGKPYYINKPGFSLADIEGAFGNVLSMIPAGAWAQGAKTLLGQGGRAAVGAGATSVAGDVAVQQMGGGNGINLEKAGIDAVTAPIAQVIGAKLFPLMNREPLVDMFGNLTPAGSKAMASAGLDPAMFTKEGLARLNDVYKRMGPDFAGDAGRAVGARVQTDQFGIPLTKGQSTQDFRQIGREEAMRNYARGQGAGDRMRAFDEQQRAAIEAAKQREIGRLSGNPTAAFPTEYEAGATLAGNIQGAARGLKQDIANAYDAAGQKTLEFQGASLPALKSQVEAAVHAADVTLKPDLTPATIAAIERVKNIKNAMQQKAATPGLPTTQRTVFEDVDFRDLETTRRQLNGLREASKNPADKRGVETAIKAFDKWIDDAVDAGLARGDQDAIQSLKKARELRTRYGTQFEKRSYDEDAGRVMERIVNTDVTPNETVNLLLGYADAGQAPVATRVATRLKSIFGEGSAEWNQYREAALMRIMNGPKGTPQGAQATVSRIDRALQGPGQSFLREIFTPEEIGRLRAFRGAINQTVAPANVRNPSKTGYEIGRLIEDGIPKILGLKALSSADPIAGSAAVGISAGKGIANNAAARSATAGVPIPPGRGYAVAPGLGAAGASEVRRRLDEARQGQDQQ